MAIFPRARGGSNTVRVGEPYQPDRLPFTRTFENLPLMEEIWRSPVDMVNILLFIHGFIHPRWFSRRISSNHE